MKSLYLILLLGFLQGCGISKKKCLRVAIEGHLQTIRVSKERLSRVLQEDNRRSRDMKIRLYIQELDAAIVFDQAILDKP